MFITANGLESPPPPLGKLLMITEKEIEILKDSQIENNKNSIKNIIHKNNRNNVTVKKSLSGIVNEKDNLLIRNQNNEYEYRKALSDRNDYVHRDSRNNDDDSRNSTLSSQSLSPRRQINKASEDKKELNRIKDNLKNKSSILKDIKSERDKDMSLLGGANKAGNSCYGMFSR